MARFFQPPEWRHVITTRQSQTLTFLDRLAIERRIEYDLNTPSVFTCRVPSANPEVNILHTDGDPFTTEGIRLCYSFRRDGSGKGGTAPWGVRQAGFVLVVEDEGDADVAMSTLQVLDPWAYLYRRPCLASSEDPNFVELPGNRGLEFRASDGWTPATIALEMLKRTIEVNGPVGIDAGAAWSGTGFYSGFIAADIPTINYNIQRGKMVGELWDDLCATELIDMELVPIYDPVNRPGYVAELSIYRQPGLVTQPRGELRPEAIFSWDKPPRTLSGIRRSIDGQQRANQIVFFNRNGLIAPGSPLIDSDSEADYGEYWYMQMFPDQSVNVRDWARAQVSLRTRGWREITPTASPQQPPLLWDEFFVGDRVPVYASNRLREKLPTAEMLGDVYERVLGLTLELDPEERISELRVTPEADVFISS